MTTGGAPRGSRDNGLRCAGYAAVADLDPRVADRLLAELRDAGIAAYVAPTPGTVGGYMETRLPNRPIDRLWVDSAQLPRARDLVAREPKGPEAIEPLGLAETPSGGGPASSPNASGPASWSTPPSAGQPGAQSGAPSGGQSGDLSPEPGAPAHDASDATDGIDFDSAWQQMVASLRTTPESPTWPEREEAGWRHAVDDDYAEADGTGEEWTADEFDPADEAHFEPPPPPPLPRLRSVTVGALALIALGLLILVSNFDGGSFTLLAAVSIVAGVASLIWNMRNGPPTDSGWDDGAVV
ncbi:MAG TPA: hypothetical protein VFT62_06675 [Mycobacteriales bacterium]|nr:hypothetical protein [Mycobacteriales bacterium]